MKISLWCHSDAGIVFSLKFSAHATENQPNRTRFCHVADILGVAENASTKYLGITENNYAEIVFPKTRRLNTKIRGLHSKIRKLSILELLKTILLKLFFSKLLAQISKTVA